MTAPLEWNLEHGRVYATGYGSIGVMHLLTPEGGDARRAVLLSLSEGQGNEVAGEYGVGDEFLLGPQVWRVDSIEGAFADYRARVVMIGTEQEFGEDDGWDYYLVDRDAGGDPVRAGTVIRVRTGDSPRNGFEAAADGAWVPSDWLYRVFELGEPGRPVQISRVRMRALLTRWVAARRLVRLPGDVPPLGSLVSGQEWDYFLLAPHSQPETEETTSGAGSTGSVGGADGGRGRGLAGGASAPDLAGEVLRCRPGGPYVAGWRFAESGEWVPDERLQREWAEWPGLAAPISEPVAWWLMTRWVNLGRFPKLPPDVYARPRWSRPVSGQREGRWEYFAVRDAGEVADPGRPTGRIMVHKSDASYRDGLVLTGDGHWVPTDELFAAVVLEDSRIAVEPITEQAAYEELSRRLGGAPALPAEPGEVVDRRDCLLFFDVAEPPPGRGLVRGFVINGPDYPSADRLDTDVRAAGDWLDARWIPSEMESLQAGSRDPADLGLPTWDQFRRAAEWDETPPTGWSSWSDARVALAPLLGADIERVGQAYTFAEDAHQGQTRPDGEPYTVHLLEVLQTLAVGVGSTDTDQLVAALLHDVVEDTAVTLDEVRERFGSVVGELVGWVTMPSSSAGDREQARLAYLGHLRQAPSAVRALKLADRYSNVQRLHTHPRPDKQRSYFVETVDHIVPLATGDPFFRPLFLAWQRRMGRLADVEAAATQQDQETREEQR